MFSVLLHRNGNPFPCETPSPWGPLQTGQSLPEAFSDKNIAPQNVIRGIARTATPKQRKVSKASPKRNFNYYPKAKHFVFQNRLIRPQTLAKTMQARIFENSCVNEESK
jgi:hypothetical protein